MPLFPPFSLCQIRVEERQGGKGKLASAPLLYHCVQGREGFFLSLTVITKLFLFPSSFSSVAVFDGIKSSCHCPDRSIYPFFLFLLLPLSLQLPTLRTYTHKKVYKETRGGGGIGGEGRDREGVTPPPKPRPRKREEREGERDLSLSAVFSSSFSHPSHSPSLPTTTKRIEAAAAAADTRPAAAASVRTGAKRPPLLLPNTTFYACMHVSPPPVLSSPPSLPTAPRSRRSRRRRQSQLSKHHTHTSSYPPSLLRAIPWRHCRHNMPFPCCCPHRGGQRYFGSEETFFFDSDFRKCGIPLRRIQLFLSFVGYSLAASLLSLFRCLCPFFASPFLPPLPSIPAI